MKLLLIASLAFGMDSVKVFNKPDGSLYILHVIPKACKKSETESDCFERISKENCPKKDGVCLPSFKMKKKDLPDNKTRDRWRKKPGMFDVFIDTSIPKSTRELMAEKTEVIKSTSSTDQQVWKAIIDRARIRARRK